MKNRIYIVFILIMSVSINFAQSELNPFKYVIVPKEYGFLKNQEDKYQLNSLTKFLFEKYGFETFFENENYPDELLNNLCLATKAEVLNNSKLLMTKLVIELRDCRNNVILTTVEGKSKEKDYKKTYHEALRRAFVSIEELDYHYEAKLDSQTDQPKMAPAKVAVPVVVAKEPTKTVIDEPKKVVSTEQNNIAKSYKNEQVSFFLIEQNGQLVAYVNESKDEAYQKGEKIGTLSKTSIPNVYRVQWINAQGEQKQTTGYFDETGNLNLDVQVDGKIEVVVFEME